MASQTNKNSQVEDPKSEALKAQTPQSGAGAKSSQAPAQAKQASFKPSEPGAVAKAWTDITGHRDWFPRVLLLMFMGVIPFLNFFVAGYLLKWATKTSNTESQGMPRHTFDGECFVWGFLFAVVQLIATIAVVFIAIFLFMIPVIGCILVWILSIFFSGYVYIAGIRMVQKKKFGNSFDLSQIFEVIKRDPWHLFLALFLPALAACAVIAVIFAVIWSIFLAANATNFFNIISGATGYGSSSLSNLGAYGSSSALRGYGSYGYTYSQPSMLASIVSLIAGGGVAFLISFLIAAFIGAFGNIWIVRSVAHWLRKTAPEWFEGRDVPYVGKPAAPAASTGSGTPAAPAGSGTAAGSAGLNASTRAGEAAGAADSTKPAAK